jgi:hypothetical protein
MRLLNENDGPGDEIIIHWRTPTGAAVDYDPNDEDSIAPEMSDEQEPTKAFVHTPGSGNHATNYQKFAEISVGDLIIDLPASIDFTDRKEVRIEHNGSFYIQKQVGRKLASVWAAGSMGERGLKTILVSLAS